MTNVNVLDIQKRDEMNDIKFTIIIPVYNSEKFLKACVTSIQEQTYKNIEILLVDDGSTDKSPEICDILAAEDVRIKVIHQENAGTSAARNKALENATGDYVMFMDNDDFWAKKEGLFEIQEQLQQSQADVLLFDATKRYGDKDEFTGESTLSRDLVLGKSAAEALDVLLKENKLVRAVWTKVIKNSLVSENSLRFPEGKRNEDTAFTADLLSVARSYDWYNYYFYIWVKTGESQTAKRTSFESMEDLKYILETRLSHLENMESGLKEMYLSYFAYPYVVLLGQVKEAAKRDKVKSKKLIQELKKYSFLIKYDLHPNVRQVKKVYSLIGYRGIVWLLGHAMEKTYRKQGVKE
jgi:glycosyltransferase involved in cell wall biosynthesis